MDLLSMAAATDKFQEQMDSMARRMVNAFLFSSSKSLSGDTITTMEPIHHENTCGGVSNFAVRRRLCFVHGRDRKRRLIVQRLGSRRAVMPLPDCTRRSVFSTPAFGTDMFVAFEMSELDT